MRDACATLGMLAGLVAVSGCAASEKTRFPPRELDIDLGGGVVLEMVLIPPGEWEMGSPIAEEGHSDDELLHRVRITKPFYMAKYETTQAQWMRVMGQNPAKFRDVRNPVEQVNWSDCRRFIKRIRQLLPGRKFRLPTEAEWEYACRAGTKTPFHFGQTISTDQANYHGKFTYGSGKKGRYRKKTTPVGSFPPNPWGIYDMHGNVWEWCADWHGEYQVPINGVATDPKGSESGDSRVMRGGSWMHIPNYCRSALRRAIAPGRRYDSVGFRVVLDLD